MHVIAARHHRHLPYKFHGFTLIELMVVLVIIGVLAALIVPNVLERADDAKVIAARVDVDNLKNALKLYKLDNQRYPSAEQGLDALAHPHPAAATGRCLPPPRCRPPALAAVPAAP